MRIYFFFDFSVTSPSEDEEETLFAVLLALFFFLGEDSAEDVSLSLLVFFSESDFFLLFLLPLGNGISRPSR